MHSILMQKMFRRFFNELEADGGEGGGGEPAAADFTPDELRRHTELEASRMGWTPKHKFKGEADKWKDAETFLKDGANFQGRLKSELAAVKQELADFKGTAKQFAEFQQRQIEQRDGEIAGLITQLKRDQRAAIRDGDDETADAIDSRIEILNDERTKTKDALKKAEPVVLNRGPDGQPIVQEDGSTKDPVVSAWIENGNTWFRENARMRAYIFQYANELIAEGETKRGQPFLDKLAEHAREAFPRYFEKETAHNTGRGQMNESGSSGGGAQRYTEADLPEEDRALMNIGIRQGWTTKEKFLKNYFSEEKRVHKTAAPAKK